MTAKADKKLSEQRKTYEQYISTINKVATDVGDGLLKGESVRDMLLILQARLLSFILSELAHMSDRLKALDEFVEVVMDGSTLSRIENKTSREEKEDSSSIESASERGQTDLLGRFQGLGLAPAGDSIEEYEANEGEEEISFSETDEVLGGTAKLLSTLATIEITDNVDEAQDKIYRRKEVLEAEEND
jgi:hypothetical protein